MIYKILISAEGMYWWEDPSGSDYLKEARPIIIDEESFFIEADCFGDLMFKMFQQVSDFTEMQINKGAFNIKITDVTYIPL